MQHLKFQLRKQLSAVDGFFIILGTFVLMNILIGGKLVPIQQLSAYLPGGVTAVNQLLVQQILQVLIMLGLTFFFLYPLRGSNLQQIGLRPFPKRRWFGYAIFFGIVAFFVMLFVSAFMIRLFPQWAEPQNITDVIVQANGTWEWIVVVFVVCALAPFSEELLFRGYIFHSLRNRYTMGLSILMTSVLFGGMHFDLFRLIPLTMIGICLNLVSVRSGSLWGSMVMHATWNLMMTIMLMVV